MHQARHRHAVFARRSRVSEHLGMQRGSQRRRQRLFDRDACQLVAERVRAPVGGEQSRCQRGRDIRRRRRQHGIDEADLDARRHDRHQVEQRAHARRLPRGAREHRVAHRRRQAVGAQCFGDEERIAAGRGEDALGGAAGLPRQFVDAGLRQRQQRHAHHGIGRQVAQHQLQRMALAEFVVAVTQHQQGAHALDATGEELDQVQRRRIGPVQVFEHDHGRVARVLRARRGRRRTVRRDDLPGPASTAVSNRARRPCRTAARAGAARTALRSRPRARGRRGARTPVSSPATSCRCPLRRRPGPCDRRLVPPQRVRPAAASGRGLVRSTPPHRLRGTGPDYPPWTAWRQRGLAPRRPPEPFSNRSRATAPLSR